MASAMVFELEPKFCKTGEAFSQFSKSAIETIQEEKYDELLEEFLD
jgi:hypothetical protein